MARVKRPLSSLVLTKSPKKKSLLRRIGPPNVKPACRYLVSAGASVVNGLRATVASVLPKLNAEPAKLLVPDLMVTLVTAPPARPNSAS